MTKTDTKTIEHLSYGLTLTANVNTTDFKSMRRWLADQNCIVPRRNDRVLAKFIYQTLSSEAPWDDVWISISVDRCCRMPDPWSFVTEPSAPAT